MSKYWAAIRGKAFDYIKVTWDDFEKFVEEAIKLLEGNKEWLDKVCVGIYGVPRGGLPIAVTLSHRLNKPLLAAPCDCCLIVDDIFDSGKTLMPMLERQCDKGNACMLTWFANVSNIIIMEPAPIFHYLADNEGKWVIFPWEQNNA